jgi:hypothetical protein
VPIRLTLDSELICTGEPDLITIRRGDPGEQELTSFYALIANRRLGHGPARRRVFLAITSSLQTGMEVRRFLLGLDVENSIQI